jgi:hypothetical protein
LTTNAQVFHTPEPSTQILKAVPLSSEEIEKLNANPAGKAGLFD